MNTSEDTSTPRPSATLRETLIAAFRKRREIMGSKDATAIRAYLLRLHADDPEAVKAYTDAPDEELLTGAEMLSSFGVSDDEFHASSTEWKVTTDTATITVHQSENDELEIILKQIDGAWL